MGKTSVPPPLVLGIPLGSILGPLFFQFTSMILLLSIQNSETDMYADETTIWLLVIMCEITCIQQSLQESLDNANCWFSLNRMKPNAKKTKQMLIGTAQKLCCVDKTCMSLFLYLTWNLRIDYVISKVN